MPNNFPTISVLMSVYNEQESWLREAIESILNQTFTDFEFIIILDNPENEMAKRIIQGYIETDKRIIFLENKENLGSGPSKNRGLKIARGKYIAIMDADDISLPERFAKQIEFMKNNPEIDLAGSWMYKMKEDGEVTGVMENSNNHILTSKLFSHRMPAFHPTWHVRRRVFDSLKGYRSVNNAEDYEFISRVIINNFKISNLQEPLLKYRFRSAQVSQKNSLNQAKAGKYLRKLHKQRLKTNYDDFNLNNLKKAVKSTKTAKQLHSKSANYFIKAIEYRDNNKKLFTFTLLFYSFLLSPYWISKRIYGFFAIKILNKKYNK